ncbi:MAG: dTDP-4-dehydrorhamnose 3,5-epimerase family protein [candidate division WOR-3 bacterium]
MIEGIEVKKLRIIPDERGFVLEILRSDDNIFTKFGQVYISVAYPGIIKAWHYHKRQTDFFTIIKGMAKVVLYDYRENSQTYKEINEFFIGELNPLLIKIPPLVLHGFKPLGNEPAYLLNIPTEVYNYKNPDEYRIDYKSKEIPYEW